MPNPSYGIAVTLVALLVVSASAGVYYYSEYQQASQSKATYAGELSTQTNRYDSLAEQYNSSLSLENHTLSLLASSIAVINTSLPAYKEASGQLSQLWSSYLALKPAAVSIYTADILMEYGNGTSVWHNATQVQPGWNMYTETVVLTRGDIKSQWYPQFGEHLITAIQGVPETETSSWFLWTYNSTSSWQPAPVGADDVPVYDGSTFAWTFCPQTPSFTPECTP